MPVPKMSFLARVETVNVVRQDEVAVLKIRELKQLCNNEGNGYENVTWKVNSRCFKVYRTYSISFSSSNVGKRFWN